MKFLISEEVRKNRKLVIENYLQKGFTPPGETGGNGSAIVRSTDELNVSAKTLREWIERESQAAYLGEDNYLPDWSLYVSPSDTQIVVEYADIPSDDLDISEILDILEKRNDRKLANAEAKNWQPIKVNTIEPIVVAFVGDPHLDDPGCNIRLLREHAELLSRKNVFAFNIGDSTNNWVGSLQRLYKDQDTSVKTARKLIKWFLHDSGINWLGWIMGNHDEWENGDTIIKLMNTQGIMMENWAAKLKLVFPTGLEVPMWLSHDFKGKSQFNKVHGNVKTARERRGACVYVSGHTHDWGAYTEEHPDTGEIYHALRARGYKFNDHYALINGFSETKHGASVAVVIDPRINDPSHAVTPFTDLEKAVKFRDAISMR